MGTSIGQMLLAAQLLVGLPSLLAFRMPTASVRHGLSGRCIQLNPSPSMMGNFGAPVDPTPLDGVLVRAERLKEEIAVSLDEEWIEQEDHLRIGGEAARCYAAARNAGSEEVGQILMAIGGGLEKCDMGECFVGPWDIANMAAAMIMQDINGVTDDCACG